MPIVTLETPDCRERDDSPDVQQVLLIGVADEAAQDCAESLSTAGFRVQQFTDVEHALASLPGANTAGIVMDCGRDAAQAIAALRGARPWSAVPIVLVGAWRDFDATGAWAGEDEFVFKPIRSLELLYRLRAAQERRRAAAAHLQDGNRAHLLALLLDFSQGVLGSPELQNTLQQLTTTAVALTGCRCVHVLLRGESSDLLRIAWSSDPERVASLQRGIAVSRSACGRVLQLGDPIVLNSPEQAAEFASADDAILLADAPLLIAPLPSAIGTIGVLIASNRLDGLTFDPAELESLELLAGTAGATIHEVMTRRSRDVARDSIVYSLAALAEQRDQQTGRHLERVTQYCLVLARSLRSRSPYSGAITDEFLHSLERAAPLHDIGKVAVPDSILLKPGPLTPEEFQRMQNHTTAGWQTLTYVHDRAPDVPFLEMARDIAHAHHERVDGAGYPRGLMGDEIPLSARILTVADVFDALTTERPYKPPLPSARAREILARGAGTAFDPVVVDAFEREWEAFDRLVIELADDARRSTPG